MSGGGGEHAILVVDDEPAVADMAAVQLQRTYDVRTAYGGRPALEALDSAVDLVLLDRRMPDLAGDEVLARIREGAHDPRVVILSAVSPDFDLLELPFDDYLCKPVAGEPLERAVDRQISTLGNEPLREYLALDATRELLAETMPAYELEQHDGFQRLLERVETAHERAEAVAAEDLEAALSVDTERV